MHKCTKGDDSMAKKRNIIVGQSGGPTSVINSSQEYTRTLSNVVSTKYTACFTESRAFWMNNISISLHRFIPSLISNC